MTWVSIDVPCPECGDLFSPGAGLATHLRDCNAPLICVCLTARPTGQWGGECVVCLRPVTQLWPPHRHNAALKAYPQIADQQVDWTYRLALITP